MKRSCDGCRALNGRLYDFHCSLGYSINEIKVYVPGINGHIYRPHPLEQCPKPKTYDELFNADHKQDNKGTTN